MDRFAKELIGSPGAACTFAVFLTVLGATLWIERGNRTAIEPLQAAEYRPCPDSDALPYSARCIEFMMGPRFQQTPEAAN